MSKLPMGQLHGIINLPGGTTIDNKAVEGLLGVGAAAVLVAGAYGIYKLANKKHIDLDAMGKKASFSDRDKAEDGAQK